MQHGSDPREGGRASLLDRYQTNEGFAPRLLVNLDNFVLIARPWRRRRILQVSALSTRVGRCLAYRGDYG